MFNIKIDKQFLAYLGERKLRIDEVVVIMCFVLGKIDLLKVFLSGRTGDQCTAFMQSLERKGLMRKRAPAVEDFDWDNYVITEQGNIVYEDCVVSVEEDIQDMVLAANIMADPVDELEDIVTSFLALWPDGTRNVNGDALKGHHADIKKKMKAFLKTYKFSKETILRGTERYLNKERARGYQYCNQAHYFISKDGISKLAAECELAEKNPENTSTWENVM